MSLIEISHLNDMERPLLFVNHELLQIRHLRRRAIAHGHLEITMYLAAVLKGAFWFNRVHDVVTGQDPATIPFQKMKKIIANHSRDLASEVRKYVYGELSGLTATETEEIERLIQAMHMHVHRAESSLTTDVLQMVRKKAMPRVEPRLDLERASIFCTPAVLVAWTHIRVLPYLSVPGKYSPVWCRRFESLESAFHYYIDAWEKPSKEAFLRLLATGFSFDDHVASEQVLRTTRLDPSVERALGGDA
ncbi:MAG: hypothetical protein H6816_02030 [Phycisphaerales bacterium]|nr:hypothetical protein [Phycisphaerales bacterium]